MEKKRKPSKDINKAALNVVSLSTGGETLQAMEPGIIPSLVSRVMAEMGRKGGLKGGKARAASLSPAERQKIAKKAAETRWKRKGQWL